MRTPTKTGRRPVVKLTPVVRFREFPFGALGDPSMRGYTQPTRWTNQEEVLSYLRSGHILAVTMGATLIDCLDSARQVDVVIDGSPVGGATPMTDGDWFWYSGLIYFVQRYNLLLPTRFVESARAKNWKVDAELVQNCDYDYSYFDQRIE